MIESIYGTPITVESAGEDVYLDINKMNDVLLTPQTALRLSDRLRKVALLVAERMEEEND